MNLTITSIINSFCVYRKVFLFKSRVKIILMGCLLLQRFNVRIRIVCGHVFRKRFFRYIRLGQRDFRCNGSDGRHNYTLLHKQNL